MRPQVGGFQYWPGYVAAVSCLVLGLLLVASIVAALTTQLGVIAADHGTTLLAQALRRAATGVVEASPAPAAVSVLAPASSRTAALAPPTVAPPLPPTLSRAEMLAPAATPAGEARSLSLPQAPPDNHLTLVFGDQLPDIPAERRGEIGTALRELAADPQVRWRIWAAAPETELPLRRSTFRLMVAVRGFLAEQGIAERRVELRLDNGPTGVVPGDIVVRVGPAEPGALSAAVPAGARP